MSHLSIAAQLQKDARETHESDNAPAMSGQGSLRSRTDEEMKLLLQTLQVSRFVCESRTHGQHNCLIGSILLALQDKKQFKPLEVHERTAICSSMPRSMDDCSVCMHALSFVSFD